MNVRYQVFVSSTFRDLKDVRKIVIEQLISSNYIPAGMELFVAADEEQFEFIKKIIDDCDYYVLIIGCSYGSISPETGKSFTEMEYDYAMSKGMPILRFICSNPELLPSFNEEDENNKKKLEEFKKKVQEKRLTKQWNEKYELAGSVINSLMTAINSHPQPGWSRGPNDEVGLLSKMNDLRDQNESLQIEINKLKATIPIIDGKIPNLAQGDYKILLHGIKKFENGDLFGSVKRISHELSIDQLYSSIAPSLYKKVPFDEFESLVCFCINEAYKLKFESINNDEIQTIKLQLEALGLVEIIINGQDEYVQITEYGKYYLKEIKLIRSPS